MPRSKISRFMLTAMMTSLLSAPIAAQANKAQFDVKRVADSKQWVNNQQDEVELRKCPAERCSVVKVVKPGYSGTKIGETADGWALLVNGDFKGYLPMSLLQSTSPSNTEDVATTNNNSRSSLENMQAQSNLKVEMDTLKERAEAAENELAELRKENYELKQELDYVKSLSSQTITVNEDNRRLKTENDALRQRNDLLEQEAGDVEGKNQRAWAMVGAGILLIGWFVGHFARSSRRKGWNEI